MNRSSMPTTEDEVLRDEGVGIDQEPMDPQEAAAPRAEMHTNPDCFGPASSRPYTRRHRDDLRNFDRRNPHPNRDNNEDDPEIYKKVPASFAVPPSAHGENAKNT